MMHFQLLVGGPLRRYVYNMHREQETHFLSLCVCGYISSSEKQSHGLTFLHIFKKTGLINIFLQELFVLSLRNLQLVHWYFEE